MRAFHLPNISWQDPVSPTRRGLLGAAAGTLLAARAARAQGQASPLTVVSPWEYTSNDPADTGYILARGIGAAFTSGDVPEAVVVDLLREEGLSA